MSMKESIVNLDARYYVAPYMGKWALYYSGLWASIHETKAEAKQAARDFHNKRMENN